MHAYESIARSGRRFGRVLVGELLRGTAPVLEELAVRLRDGGAPVTWDDRLPGFRRFYTADPWGNRLELLAVDVGDTTGL